MVLRSSIFFFFFIKRQSTFSALEKWDYVWDWFWLSNDAERLENDYFEGHSYTLESCWTIEVHDRYRAKFKNVFQHILNSASTERLQFETSDYLQLHCLFIILVQYVVFEIFYNKLTVNVVVTNTCGHTYERLEWIFLYSWI